MKKHLTGASFNAADGSGEFYTLSKRTDGGFNVMRGTPYELTECATLDEALELLTERLTICPTCDGTGVVLKRAAYTWQDDDETACLDCVGDYRDDDPIDPED